MSAPQDKIDLIRCLIVKYYDGTISDSDLDTLTDFFNTADLKIIPADMVEDAEIFMMLRSASDVLSEMVPDDLENRIRAVTVDKTDKRRKFILNFFVRPVAAAAFIAVIFTSIRFMQHEPTYIEVDQKMPTIFVKLAPQADEEKETPSDLFAETISPTDNFLTPKVSQTIAATDYEVDNYFEITNYDQATILTQDAMSLVRAKLAVAGFSICSASEGLRQIDTTIRDIIAN